MHFEISSHIIHEKLLGTGDMWIPIFFDISLNDLEVNRYFSFLLHIEISFANYWTYTSSGFFLWLLIFIAFL